MSEGGRKHLALLVLLLLVGGAAAIRLPGVFWHIEVEGKPVNILTDESTFIRHFRGYPEYRGAYPTQIHMLMRLLYPLAKWTHQHVGSSRVAVQDDYFICVVGRLTALLIGLGVIVFFFCAAPAVGFARLCERTLIAGTLAFAPLLSVYGHLFLADVLNLLWIYLGYWAFLRYLKQPLDHYLLLFAFATGAALSAKLSAPYFVLTGAVLLLLSRRVLYHGAMMGLVVLGTFWMGSGFNYGVEQFKGAREWLGSISGNQSSVFETVSSHLAFMSEGVGMPLMALVALGVGLALVRGSRQLPALPRLIAAERRIDFWWTPSSLLARLRELLPAHGLLVVGLGLLLPYATMISSEASRLYSRQMIPFIPVVAFAGAATLRRLLGSVPRWCWVVILAVLGYGVLLSLEAEQGYRHDRRQEVRNWLQQHLRASKLPIYADPACPLLVSGLPHQRLIGLGESPIPPQHEPHYFVTHQQFYARYLIADRCAKIHHCYGGDAAREFMVRLITGRLPGYRLLYRAKVDYKLPEHVWLTRFIPIEPEPLVGETRVYEYRPPAAHGQQGAAE